MKARAQSLLTGKLGSLVRAKPPRPLSASIAKPPLPPAAVGTKSPRPASASVIKSPRSPLSPTGPLGGNQREQEERKRQTPVIKPYLVKKSTEEKSSESGTVLVEYSNITSLSPSLQPPSLIVTCQISRWPIVCQDGTRKCSKVSNRLWRSCSPTQNVSMLQCLHH